MAACRGVPQLCLGRLSGAHPPRQAREWRSAVELLAQGLRTKDSILSNPLVAGPAAQAVVRGLLLVAP